MPRISVIIPARNEERYLPIALASIQAAAARAQEAIECIVVLNRCEDGTEKIAQEHSCILVREDARNLSIIRNAGVRASSGEVVVTLDADSRVSENMFQHILRSLDSGSIGGGVFIFPERWSLGIFCTGLLLLPIILRDRIFGGLFFCRRETFDAIGGFNETMVSAEDVDFAKRLKRYGENQGKRFHMLWRAWIVTSCRKFDVFGDWHFVKTWPRFRRIFEGADQNLANEFWYDCER